MLQKTVVWNSFFVDWV